MPFSFWWTQPNDDIIGDEDEAKLHAKHLQQAFKTTFPGAVITVSYEYENQDKDKAK